MFADRKRIYLDSARSGCRDSSLGALIDTPGHRPRSRGAYSARYPSRRLHPANFYLKEQYAASLENEMRLTRWLTTASLALMLTGCAGISTTPTPEARQGWLHPESCASGSSSAAHTM